MKKILVMALICMTLVGCGKKENTPQDGETEKQNTDIASEEVSSNDSSSDEIGIKLLNRLDNYTISFDTNYMWTVTDDEETYSYGKEIVRTHYNDLINNKQYYEVYDYAIDENNEKDLIEKNVSHQINVSGGFDIVNQGDSRYCGDELYLPWTLSNENEKEYVISKSDENYDKISRCLENAFLSDEYLTLTSCDSFSGTLTVDKDNNCLKEIVIEATGEVEEKDGHKDYDTKKFTYKKVITVTNPNTTEVTSDMIQPEEE